MYLYHYAPYTYSHTYSRPPICPAPEGSHLSFSPSRRVLDAPFVSINRLGYKDSD